ncbi:oxidoreductase [Pokkaliibacter plantistimulans]|uniref:Oxidoreductase n=1 Tax=Proteobacteria bacterium 228 TaxID=2083153 RepID=A0A2S5KTK4_9PROT|nr:SDR family NAD(P)-dependent oxidoreductase [Pokkaliibacter plantistimulans]PPC77859.1 oxidoreductase [Pokkaliibacter plantistimulans]
MSNHSLPWQCVWLTGASQGIGLALAEALAQQGVTVCASARNEEALQALARRSRLWSGKVVAYPLDITDSSAVAETLAHIEAEQGLPQLVIFNAGSHHPTPATRFQSDEVRQLLELNVMGTCHCLEAILPRYIQHNTGHIAVVASLAGYRGLPSAAGYGASKAALNNLLEALAIDLYHTNIRLQIINPGFVRTPLTDRNAFPMPFLMEPEQAAAAIIHGLQSGRAEIRFPRRFALLMGLLRLLPAGLYRYLIARATGYDRAV